MCVANVAPQYLICIADDNLTANCTTWLHNVSNETISKLLELAKLAFDGTNKDELIFHGRVRALETLGKVYGLFSLQYCI